MNTLTDIAVPIDDALHPAPSSEDEGAVGVARRISGQADLRGIIGNLRKGGVKRNTGRGVFLDREATAVLMALAADELERMAADLFSYSRTMDAIAQTPTRTESGQ